MPSQEEFDTLKRRVDDLELLVRRLAPSHKDVLEKYLPELANRVAEHIASTGEQTTSQMAKITELANGMTSMVEAFDRRFDALEAMVFIE